MQKIIFDGRIKAVFLCPYCGHESSSFDDAKAHDATCPKHPAVIRAGHFIKALEALRKYTRHLIKEADWLADRCLEFCDFNNYCDECALYPGDLDFPHPDCGLKIDIENARWRFGKHVVSDWREAAYKAVEEEQCKK